VGFNQIFVWFLAGKIALLIKLPDFDSRFGQPFDIPPQLFDVMGFQFTLFFPAGAYRSIASTCPERKSPQ